MLLGVIADDFTGASDIANTLARGRSGRDGLRCAQFVGIPKAPAPAEIEAGVIALKSRSIPPEEAVAQSLAALDWLRRQGCRQYVFKYCSTFDSTPRGNIGPVGEALARALEVKGVVACPAFPKAGRTVYQGHLFVQDRLLNESGMQHHPLNPMSDPDIRRWLALQTSTPPGLVPLSVVRSGASAIAAALSTAAGEGQTLVIVDAVLDEDLLAIGGALAGQPLVTGGSGIALGLPANLIAAGWAEGSSPPEIPVDGPEAILAGSCSAATRKQVERHACSHPALAIDIEAVMGDKIGPEDLVRFIEDRRGEAPMAYSSAEPDHVAAVQRRFGANDVAHALESLFARTARKLVERGTRRLVVAGGETSGAVVSALDVGALTVGPEIEPGVPALYSQGAEPIALALKSGNFGTPGFFMNALRKLEGGDD